MQGGEGARKVVEETPRIQCGKGRLPLSTCNSSTLSKASAKRARTIHSSLRYLQEDCLSDLSAIINVTGVSKQIKNKAKFLQEGIRDIIVEAAISEPTTGF